LLNQPSFPLHNEIKFKEIYSLFQKRFNHDWEFIHSILKSDKTFLLQRFSFNIETVLIILEQNRKLKLTYFDHKKEWAICLFYLLFKGGIYPQYSKVEKNVFDILDNKLESYLTHTDENIREIAKSLLSFPQNERIKLLAEMLTNENSDHI